MKSHATPFEFLQGIIHVLCIDDDEAIHRMVKDMFGDMPLFTMHHAYTSQAGEELIATHPIRICLLDLGIQDQHNDQFYILRKFARHFPIIVFSSRQSIDAGSESKALGAFWATDKHAAMNMDKFFEKIREAVYFGFLCCPIPDELHERFEEAYQTLIAQKPAKVEDWAAAMKISSVSYLRTICGSVTQQLDLSLREIILFFHLLDHALDHNYNQNINLLSPPRPRLDAKEYAHLKDYYFLHLTAANQFFRRHALYKEKS